MATTPAVFEIPLVSAPQDLQISLSGNDYRLVITWNWLVELWMLDIYDARSNTPMVLGTPLVTGADLLEQFAHMGFPGSLVVQTDHDPMTVPTFNNLGYLSHLFYVPFDGGASGG